jgi:hypothetical protein
VTRIKFDQLGEMDSPPKMRIHGVNVGFVSISRELKNAGYSGAKIAHEIPRGVRIAFTDVVGDDELCFAVQRKPRPNSSPLLRSVGAQTFFVASHKGMHLIGLYKIRMKVANRGVKQSLAFVPSTEHEVENCSDVESSEPRDCAYTRAFHHQFEHSRSSVNVGVVRFEPFDRLGECSFAGLAAPALNAALTEVTELLQVWCWHFTHVTASVAFSRMQP